MTVLNKSIGRVLAVAVLLSGGNASAHWMSETPRWGATPFDTTGTSDLPPVQALPPEGEPSPGEPPDQPGHEGGGGGDGGEGNQQPPTPRCAELLASRPNACPNPIALPQGAYYGEDSIPGSTVFHSSSIRMAIGFSKRNAPWNGVTIEPNEGARMFLEAALKEQTENFAAGMSLVDANARFRTHLAMACNQQVAADSYNRNSIVPTKSEQFCFEMLKSFDSEANDEKSFIAWFADYSRSTGIPLDSYVPYGILTMEDAKNSIGEKWRRVTEDSTCSRWWDDFKVNVCEVP
nr:hypothetical protein [Stenotrophomonas maltophilia]